MVGKKTRDHKKIVFFNGVNLNAFFMFSCSPVGVHHAPDFSSSR